MSRTKWVLFTISLMAFACGPVDSSTPPDEENDGGGDARIFDAGGDHAEDAGGDVDNLEHDMADGTDTGTSGEDAGEGPTLGHIFEEVFVATGCTAGYCHGGAVDELLMSNAETTYATVGQPSEFGHCADQLVVPGEPENSELWYRIRPAGMNGGKDCEAPKMPRGSDGLSEENAQLVYDWIAAGAKR